MPGRPLWLVTQFQLPLLGSHAASVTPAMTVQWHDDLGSRAG
jgi:hypothetical protein